MPVSLKHAKRLVNALRVPTGVAQVLTDTRYWDSRVLEVLFDKSDELIFHDSSAGLALARVLPDLALLVPEGDSIDERREHRERLVRAHATLGGALRAVHQLQEANEPYRRALTLAAAVSPLVQADLYQRLAALRACQKDFSEALRLSDTAIATFREHNKPSELACALTVRGFACLKAGKISEALENSSEALLHTDPKQNERVHYAALHNVASAATRSTNLDAVSLAWPKIREARRLIKHHRKSIPKLKLYWIEGLLLQKLFLNKRAEQLYHKARRGFIALEAGYELALCDLSLGSCYVSEKRWVELEALSAQTLEHFRAFSHADVEALAALRLWAGAVSKRTLHGELLGQVRETMFRRMAEHRVTP